MDKQNEKAMVDMYNQEMKDLQDNQKQIEEIAKIISSDTCDKDCSNKCAFCCANAEKEAERIYNAGYRKIPESAVVLTREEYDDMFSFKTTRGGFYNILDTVRKVERKETVEKFAVELKGNIKNHKTEMYLNGLKGTPRTNELTYECVEEYIDETAKEIIEGE